MGVPQAATSPAPGVLRRSGSAAMSSAKAPYYYSELGPDKNPLEGNHHLALPEESASMPAAPPSASTLAVVTTPARLNGTPPPCSSDPIAETSDSPVVDEGVGFFNPLLSIEPDVSVPDTPPRQNNHKKKKAKKKGSPSKSNGIYSTTTAYARQLLFGGSAKGGGEKKSRRGSEPNIYEEITDAEEQYAAASAARSEQYLRVGGAPTIPRRPRPPPPYEGAPSHVREEVTRVHRTHAHILENLNLDVETMLMPEALPLGESSCLDRGEGGYGTVAAKLGRAGESYHHPAATWRRVMNEYVEHRSAPGELHGGTLPARASKLHRIPYASHKSECHSPALSALLAAGPRSCSWFVSGKRTCVTK